MSHSPTHPHASPHSHATPSPRHHFGASSPHRAIRKRDIRYEAPTAATPSAGAGGGGGDSEEKKAGGPPPFARQQSSSFMYETRDSQFKNSVAGQHFAKLMGEIDPIVSTVHARTGVASTRPKTSAATGASLFGLSSGSTGAYQPPGAQRVMNGLSRPLWTTPPLPLNDLLAGNYIPVSRSIQPPLALAASQQISAAQRVAAAAAAAAAPGLIIPTSGGSGLGSPAASSTPASTTNAAANANARRKSISLPAALYQPLRIPTPTQDDPRIIDLDVSAAAVVRPPSVLALGDGDDPSDMPATIASLTRRENDEASELIGLYVRAVNSKVSESELTRRAIEAEDKQRDAARAAAAAREKEMEKEDERDTRGAGLMGKNRQIPYRERTLSSEERYRDTIEEGKMVFFRYLVGDSHILLQIELEVIDGELDMFISKSEYFPGINRVRTPPPLHGGGGGGGGGGGAHRAAAASAAGFHFGFGAGGHQNVQSHAAQLKSPLHSESRASLHSLASHSTNLPPATPRSSTLHSLPTPAATPQSARTPAREPVPPSSGPASARGPNTASGRRTLSHRQQIQQQLVDEASRLTVQWHYRGLSRHHTITITGTDPSFASGCAYYFGLKARSPAAPAGGLSSGGGGATRNVGFRISVGSYDTVNAPLVTRQKTSDGLPSRPNLKRKVENKLKALLTKPERKAEFDAEVKVIRKSHRLNKTRVTLERVTANASHVDRPQEVGAHREEWFTTHNELLARAEQQRNELVNDRRRQYEARAAAVDERLNKLEMDKSIKKQLKREQPIKEWLRVLMFQRMHSIIAARFQTLAMRRAVEIRARRAAVVFRIGVRRFIRVHKAAIRRRIAMRHLHAFRTVVLMCALNHSVTKPYRATEIIVKELQRLEANGPNSTTGTTANTVAAHSQLIKSVRNYRQRIINAQRLFRRVYAARRAKLDTLTRQWDRAETKLLTSGSAALPHAIPDHIKRDAVMEIYTRLYCAMWKKSDAELEAIAAATAAGTIRLQRDTPIDAYRKAREKWRADEARTKAHRAVVKQKADSKSAAASAKPVAPRMQFKIADSHMERVVRDTQIHLYQQSVAQKAQAAKSAAAAPKSNSIGMRSPAFPSSLNPLNSGSLSLNAPNRLSPMSSTHQLRPTTPNSTGGGGLPPAHRRAMSISRRN